MRASDCRDSCFGDAIAIVFRVAREFILQNFSSSAILVAFPDIGIE
jgi:hypothetical protein